MEKDQEAKRKRSLLHTWGGFVVSLGRELSNLLTQKGNEKRPLRMKIYSGGAGRLWKRGGGGGKGGGSGKRKTSEKKKNNTVALEGGGCTGRIL